VSARELEAIPVARGRLVQARRDDAIHRLGESQHMLDALAADASEREVDVEDVDAALDARNNAHAIAGEWIAQWRSH
jgi:hypothetical protein